MSTSREELADRLEAFLRVLESARRCENKAISVWSGDVEVVSEALDVVRLAATPKAGVDREVIAPDLVAVPRGVLKQIEFASNGYCPACDGWMVDKWRGATPGKHTPECELAKAMAGLVSGGGR